MAAIKYISLSRTENVTSGGTSDSACQSLRLQIADRDFQRSTELSRLGTVIFTRRVAK